MLIRNNKNAPASLFIASLGPGHQRREIDAKAVVAFPDELDGEILENAGTADLFKGGDLEEITPDHVRVHVPRDDRRPRVRLKAPIDDAVWRRDPCKPSERCIEIRSGESELVHPDFLASPGAQRLIESGTLEVRV